MNFLFFILGIIFSCIVFFILSIVLKKKFIKKMQDGFEGLIDMDIWKDDD